MSDDLHGTQPVDDAEDIPVLTDIVVPGRLRAEPPPAQAPSDFVFDIEFDRPAAVTAPPAQDEALERRWESESPAPIAAVDDDLPLPWADERPATPAPADVSGAPVEPTPEAVSAPLPPRDREPDAVEPPIVAAAAEESAASAWPPDTDAERLLRELLVEVGNGLERRLAQELADTERRLRAALREELDTRLRELLAGAPPNT